ncbi:MAG: hypothetical protein JXR37_10960 [Kiritimatiellae bacterium]|nr:hypothetical protein [Kiritimatiellia bacterium]
MEDGNASVKDGELIARFAREGSEQAFRALVDRYSQLIYAACLQGGVVAASHHGQVDVVVRGPWFLRSISKSYRTPSTYGPEENPCAMDDAKERLALRRPPV